MATITHEDHRVADAFEARKDAQLHYIETDWSALDTSGNFPDSRRWMRANLEAVEYPAWHVLHPVQAYRVEIHGEGDFHGATKAAAMRHLVKRTLGLTKDEFEYLNVREGGSATGDSFSRTYWVFTEHELDAALGLYS